MEALEEADTENQRMILRETARQYPAPFSYPPEKKRQRTSQDVEEAKEVKEAQSVSPGAQLPQQRQDEPLEVEPVPRTGDDAVPEEEKKPPNTPQEDEYGDNATHMMGSDPSVWSLGSPLHGVQQAGERYLDLLRQRDELEDEDEPNGVDAGSDADGGSNGRPMGLMAFEGDGGVRVETEVFLDCGITRHLVPDCRMLRDKQDENLELAGISGPTRTSEKGTASFVGVDGCGEPRDVTMGETYSLETLDRVLFSGRGNCKRKAMQL
eukprot:g33616.t1